jgi:hypothetical protein
LLRTGLAKNKTKKQRKREKKKKRKKKERTEKGKKELPNRVVIPGRLQLLNFFSAELIHLFSHISSFGAIRFSRLYLTYI